MTRDEVLDVLQELGAVTPAGGRQEGFLVALGRQVLEAIGALATGDVSRDEVPVRFIRHSVVVCLPEAAFTESRRMNLEGRFQSEMTKRHASAYLDFAPEWKGLDTPLRHGFN